MADGTALVIAVGIAGIATSYYLSSRPQIREVVLIDRGHPMAFTSAQSGENYRNWWPHPVMTAFTDLSISLMEELALESGNRFSMTRRGYALATRRTEIDDILASLREGYAGTGPDELRVCRGDDGVSYDPPASSGWETAPGGVDILLDAGLIRRTFPSFDPDIASVIHIRRAGDVDSQQLGQYMLSAARAAGLRFATGTVRAVAATTSGFTVDLETPDGTSTLGCDLVFNAAGPFVGQVGAMLGYDLPVVNVRQQKIAFEDEKGAIPRDMPFSIDLDEQLIDWEPEDRDVLAEDGECAWLTEPMPGGVHCKPDGAEQGRWVKLGWAYTREPTEPLWNPLLDDRFPEVVLRGAARLNPGLRAYYERLPGRMSHYGGYYTMTRENWPLIGPAGPDGSYVIGALSGFGTMAACAAGHLAAAIATGDPVPEFAGLLGLARYRETDLITRLEAIAHRSLL